MPVYDHIGQGYDQTRCADPYIVDRLAHHLKLRSNASYLDIACGTGNYTLALANRCGVWHGIDQSPQMIQKAQAKSHSVIWSVADAEVLSYTDRIFSGVVCSLTIHHFRDLDRVFQEVYRVMRNGQFVIFTATPEQIRRYWLSCYFPDAIHRSAEQMPDLQSITATLTGVGFTSIQTELYFVQKTLQDLFLYSGKYRPKLYLDPAVRAGISTFSLLATAQEVEVGCRRLAEDIETGAIAQRINLHANAEGDYLFIIASV
jgi:ubiquinone/menaquinone biosynthesis C-methylase UbiE